MSYGRYPYGGIGYAGSDAAEIAAHNEPILSVEWSPTTRPLQGPVWVGITEDVRFWSSKRGRRRELERFQPGRATIVLNNREGQFDSATNADVRPSKRLRIRQTFREATYPIFDGFADSWDPSYPNVNQDAVVTLTATDGFKLLARTDLPRSVWFDRIETDDPPLWFRIDETVTQVAADTTALNAGSLGSTADGTYVGPPELGQTSLPVKDPGGSMRVVSSDTNPGTENMGIFVSDTDFDLSDHDRWAVEAWVRPEVAESTQGHTIYRAANPSGGNNLNLLYDVSTGVGRFRGVLSVPSAGATFSVSDDNGGAGYPPHEIYHVVFRHDTSGDLVLFVNNDKMVGDNTTTGPAADSDTYVGHDNAAAAATNWVGIIDELIVWTGTTSVEALTDSQIASHFAAGATPWQGDRSESRANRVLNQGWAGPRLRDIDTTTTPTYQSAAIDGQSILDHLHKVAETEFGKVFMDRTGRVRLVSRANVLDPPGPFATFGDRNAGLLTEGGDSLVTESGDELSTEEDVSGHVGYQNVVFDDGDSTIRNRATISRLNGVAKTATDDTSIGEFGRFQYTLEGLLHDSDSYSDTYATFIVAEYGSLRRRVEELTMGSPPAGEEAVAYPAVLARELNDSVVVELTPFGGTPFSQTVVIEQIQASGTPGRPLEVTWKLSPVPSESF